MQGRVSIKRQIFEYKANRVNFSSFIRLEFTRLHDYVVGTYKYLSFTVLRTCIHTGGTVSRS